MDLVVICKLDQDGNFKWAKALSSSLDYVFIYDIISYSEFLFLDVQYVGDFSLNTINGNLSLPTTSSIANRALIKMDTLGNILDAISFNNLDLNYFTKDAIDADGNLYLYGNLNENQITVGNDNQSYLYDFGDNNSVIFKFDQDLKPIWQYAFRKAEDEYYNSNSSLLALDKEKNIYIADYFTDTLRFIEEGDTTLYLSNDYNIYVLKLSQCESSHDLDVVSTCDSYSWQGEVYDSSGLYEYVTQNVEGCDSILQLDLTINHPTEQMESITACDSYQWQGDSYNTSGIYTLTMQNIHGCDSTLTLDLTVYQSDEIEVSVTACDSYQWQGDSYNTSGIYSLTMQNIHGCDSTLTLDLTVYQSNEIEESVTACDNYQWQGNTYDTSGIYQLTTQNIYGCDSILTLDLTIYNSDKIEESVTACDSYLWQGNTYDTSGIYQWTTQNLHGCDSTLTLDLTIYQSYLSEQDISACNEYAWHGSTYYDSGIYTFNTTSQYGCDSTEILHLTISDSINTYETRSICTGDSVQVFGSWYSDQAMLEAHFLTSAGCDSISHIEVNLLPLPTDTKSLSICEGDSVFIQNQWIKSAGIYVDRVQNLEGCDSLHYIELSIIPSISTLDTMVICHGDTIDIFGNQIDTEGLYSEYYTADSGCDSISYLYLSVLPAAEKYVELDLCPWDSIFIADQWVSESGNYTSHLSAANGCDSSTFFTIHKLTLPDHIDQNIDCENGQIKLSIEVSDEWNVSWDNGDTGSEVYYLPTDSATVVISSLTPCMQSYSIHLISAPDINSLPELHDTLVTTGETVTINLMLDNQWNVLWQSQAAISCDTCKNTSITVDKDTQVLLNLTHSSGCEYELKFKINTTNTEPAIANAFSPNGDGVNDVWDVNLSKEYKIISAGIYDRWGSLIYSPPTGHSNINWDGKKANKYVNDGIYVFLIKYQDEHEKEYILQGDIMVVK